MTSDRWAQSQVAVAIPAGQDYVTVAVPTVDNQLMDGSNLSTVALVNVSGAELALDQPSPATVWDNDEGMYLEWSIEVGEDSNSAFYGVVRATTNGDGSLDADGVDNQGRSFHAHITVNRTTFDQTIDLTINGLPPEDDHWTGTTENAQEVNGRFPMYSDSLNGSGMFAGLFAEQAVAAATKPELQVEIGATVPILKPQRNGGTASQPVATGDQLKAITKIRMDNGWDATNSVISPLHTVGGGVYGLSGFVIGVTGTVAGDSGTVTVKLVPYKIVFKDRGQETVNLGGIPTRVVPGPANTTTHEDWHIEGVNAMWLQNYNINNAQFLIGFKNGFNNAMDRIKQKDAIKNAASIDSLKQLVMMELQSEKAAIANAGKWHNPASVPNATQDLNA